MSKPKFRWPGTEEPELPLQLQDQDAPEVNPVLARLSFIRAECQRIHTALAGARA